MNIDYELLSQQLDSLCEIEAILGRLESPLCEHVTGICNLLGEMISANDLPDNSAIGSLRQE